MKCRLIVPVSLLTWLVCFGGVSTSAFEPFRLMGEEAVVEEPAPLDMGTEEFGVGQKNWGAAQKGKRAVQKDCGPAQKDCGPAQKGCEPFAFSRPWLRGFGKASCEPVCGPAQKGGCAVQKDCGPAQKACGPVQKGECAAQKDCGPVAQKGCDSLKLSCRPRLRGWDKMGCETATCCGGAEQKAWDLGKGSVQKATQK